VKRAVNNHYESIIERTQHISIDILFLVNPEAITSGEVIALKKIHPSLKVYIYMWDSVMNKRRALTLLPVSDRFITFDPEDKKIDARISFLPLFYTRAFEGIVSRKAMTYDVCFVGSLHSDRYRIVKSACFDGLSAFHFFFSPSRALFFVQRLVFAAFRRVDLQDVSFQSLSFDQISGAMKKSLAVIDIEHPNQVGLTMRTIESLGARKKLITTNANIKEYDFYDSDNICIVNREMVSVEGEFFAKPYKSLRPEIYNKYSLRNWLIEVFGQ
jgi:hypothetical protein